MKAGRKLRSQRTAQTFYAKLSDKLRLFPSAEPVLGFKRPAQGNRSYDEECHDAAKNATCKETLQSTATLAIVENYREKRREECCVFGREKREQEILLYSATTRVSNYK